MLIYDCFKRVFERSINMANPTLGERVLNKDLSCGASIDRLMTISGTIGKTCLLGLLMAITFAYNWSLLLAGQTDKAVMLSHFGIFAGIVLALFILFGPKNKFLSITTSLYAMCEGLTLGYISALVNQYYPGVASQAAIGTIFALFGMFFLYKTNIVKCTDTFRMVIFNSTLAICGIYVLHIILSLFHVQALSSLFSSSPIGIGFSIVVVAIATFNLVIDFDSIERFSGQANKHYEWYFGFSLLVTIIWMYIEILNLLMKLQSKK
jgi:uncharacterized YccA/Bax inhibitor family protein